MGKKWGWLWNFDTAVLVIVLLVVAYYIFTSERKKYPCLGLGTPDDVSQALSAPVKLEAKKYFREDKCRRIFERLFDAEFPSVRPDFLRNPLTGRNLELDGYCPFIRTPKGQGLAFEYDGEQHRKLTPRFHPNGVSDLRYQIEKDTLKDKQCRDKGIVLIRIPDFVVDDDLDTYIRKRLVEEKVYWF